MIRFLALIALPIAFASERTLGQGPGSPLTEAFSDYPNTEYRRALIAFLRFADDVDHRPGCTEAAEQWRHPDTLPSFSEHILAPDSIPPFAARSLTDYFFQQSNGRLILFGRVYPKVVVSEKDEHEYALVPSNTLDLGRLAREVMTTIDESPEINLSRFDANNDGIIDYIFLIIRHLRGVMLTPQGASAIASLGFTSNEADFGRDPFNRKRIVFGSFVVFDSRGNVFPRVDLVRLMAHEYGHGLRVGPVRYAGGLAPIGGEFGVPSNDPGRIGYFLMAQRGNSGGSYTMEAAERDLIQRDWIRCSTLQRDTTVAISDLYTTSQNNCFKFAVGPSGSPSRTVYVSNRQRVGVFDALLEESCGGQRSHRGLMTTGILISMVDAERNVAVLAADNSLELSEVSDAYDGDMFGPESTRQLTPFTRPNIHGYSRYPPGIALGSTDFPALDSIRYDGQQDGSITLEYIADFRKKPVFREDSWIGEESSGVRFAANGAITDFSHLRISTDVSFDCELIVEGGSSVKVTESGAVEVDTLLLEDGARLFVDGRVEVYGAYFRAVGATVSVSSTGVFSVALEEAKPAAPRNAHSLFPAFPNPVFHATTISYTLSQSTFVTLSVFNLLGRQIDTLVSGSQPAGVYEFRFNALGLPGGVYFYRLDAGSYSGARALVVAK